MNHYDIIIVGAGLSGMYVALNLDRKYKVLLLSKGSLVENNSYLAQGGIAAVISNDDDFKNHIEDSLKAGSNINDLEALNVLVTKASQNIKRLENYGAHFDRDEYGNFLTTLEGGHSFKRILHAGGDSTGRMLVESLVNRVKTLKNVDLLENVMVVDLIRNEEQCLGIRIMIDHEIQDIYSQATVLTTGGVGGVYQKTTNSSVATGDGVAIAHRANVQVNNMEFIQFHPTVFFEKGKEGKHFLISEAVRGEGAILRNIHGERFMTKYHRDKELAPRDVVSQAIFNELNQTSSEYVYLDITHKTREFLENRFPSIYQYCLEHGIDMSKDFIPVAPAEHFSIGGISINLHGESSLDRLFASGECADSGVHGANRLASNSLLECVVFGRSIASTINQTLKPSSEYNSSRNIISFESKEQNFDEIKNQIKITMQEHVGIVRTTEGLNLALSQLNRINETLLNDEYRNKAYYETLNMLTVAILITQAAINRKESIGCHLRIN